jgi:hypothetical protein
MITALYKAAAIIMAVGSLYFAWRNTEFRKFLAGAFFVSSGTLLYLYLAEFRCLYWGGVDGELDIHVAFDLAAAGLVDELFGRFSHERVAVVVEPVDQRPDRGKFLILDNGGVIARPQQIAARLKLAQKPLVIDVKAERLRGGIEVGTVNEQREFFFVRGHEFSLVIET